MEHNSQEKTLAQLLEENKRLYQQVAELEARLSSAASSKYLACLVEISGLLLDDPDVFEVLPTVLQKLLDVSGADRSYFFENYLNPDTGKQLCRQRYEICRAGITPQIDNACMQDFEWQEIGFQRWIDLFSQGEQVNSRFDELPSVEREFLDGQDIVTIMAIPVMIEQKLLGVIGFDACRENVSWSHEEVRLLRNAGNAVGSAIKRQYAQSEIQAAGELLEQRINDRTRELSHVNDALTKEITQRKQIELELRRKTDTIESVLNAVMMIGPQGLVTDVNESALTMLGYQTKQEIVGQLATDFWPDTPANSGLIPKLLGGGSWQGEVLTKTESGTLLWTYLSVRPADPKANQSVARIVSFVDITEQKRTEEQLQQKTDALDCCMLAISIHNLDGNIIYANRAFEDLLGLEPGTALNLHPQQFSTNKEKITDCLKHLQHNTCFHERDTLQRQDGTYINVDLFVSKIINAKNSLAGYMVLLTTIEQHKQIESRVEWESELNAACTDLTQKLLEEHSLDEMAYLVLEYAKILTSSTHGYVGYFDPETGFLVSSTLSRDMWETCQVTDKSVVFEEFKGLWGWVLDHRQPLMTNAPSEHAHSSGVPEGHLPIHNFLSVPAMNGDTLLGQIALANATRPYTEQDLECVERLAAIYGIAIQRVRWEQGLETALQSKQAVLEEIHQIVASNLHLVSNLLRMQSRSMHNPLVREMLKESEDRIYAVALIHEHLSRSGKYSRVLMSLYLEELLDRLKTSYAVERHSLKIVTKLSAISLPIQTAIPCGLVMNELVTHAIKTFMGLQKSGKITVEFEGLNDQQVKLLVSDNGIGLPSGWNSGNNLSVGLQLVRSVCDNYLHGHLHATRQNGVTTFCLVFDSEPFFDQPLS